MIKNILIRRKESETYLATVRKHRWSLQVAMKEDKMCSFQPALWPSSAEESKPGRCRCLSFLLIYFLSFYLSRFSFYIDILYRNVTHLDLCMDKVGLGNHPSLSWVFPLVQVVWLLGSAPARWVPHCSCEGT